jgi:L-fuculose-phosphate aldolase
MPSVLTPKLRSQLVLHSRKLHAMGWVANHDGNLSCRLPQPGRFLCTPTATSKAEVTAELLLVVDDKGARVAGETRPFGEIGLHLAVFAARADVTAVVHAHPPCATALACAGSPLIERPFIAEAVVSLGPVIPTVPTAAPGKAAVAALQPFVAAHDAVLLGGHGVLAWGMTLEQAYLRLELVEHLARIALAAAPAGGPRPLPEEMIAALVESRRKAGLGQAADATRMPPPAPAPSPRGGGSLESIIREELTKVL